MHNRIKHILFIIILIVLFLPIIQNKLSLIEENPLKGSFELAQKDSLNLETWFDGSFQKQYSKYINDTIGLRSTLVRLNNQIRYSLFKIVNTKLTVIGKNKHLFQSDYIDAYMGYDFVGEERVKSGIKKLDFIQKKLKENDINFMLVFAPGKASFMPKNIPSHYDIEKKGKTNYEEYLSLLENSNLNFLDLRKYFLKIKSTSRFPLYPINGTHWSGYGSTIASDTISKYISKLMDIEMVKQIDIGGYFTDTDMRWSDDDLTKSMNVFQEICNFKMYYPNVIYIPDSNATKPNTLFIGDSYLQSFYKFYPYFENCFGKNTSYWNYNVRVKWDNNKKVYKDIFVRDLNIGEEALTRELVVILISQPNIKFLDKLLTDRLYKLFLNKGDKEYFNNRVSKQIERIKNNPEWFAKIKQQAKERNISVDEMLRKNAVYFLKIKKTANNN